MALNVAIVVPWVRSGLAGPHAGLATATSLSAFLNAGLLLRGLYRAGVWRPDPGWRRFLLQVGAAVGVMGMLLYQFVDPTRNWLEVDLPTRIWWLAVSVGGGAAAYFAVLFAVGLRPAALRMTSTGGSL